MGMTASGEDGVLVGLGGDERLFLRLDRANRHGLVAGATGTGKTVTLQITVPPEWTPGDKLRAA